MDLVRGESQKIYLIGGEIKTRYIGWGDIYLTQKNNNKDFFYMMCFYYRIILVVSLLLFNTI